MEDGGLHHGVRESPAGTARRVSSSAAAAGDERRTWNQSAERAATILSQFTCDEPALRVSGLAERLSLHPSTVYRYLEALEDAHLLERDLQRGTYKLGIKVVELSAVFLRDLPVRRHASMRWTACGTVSACW